MEELKEFLIHKSDFGSSVKACMVKVFTEEEMKTCSVRGKKTKDGKQRNCLPQEKLNAIIGKFFFIKFCSTHKCICVSLVSVMCYYTATTETRAT